MKKYMLYFSLMTGIAAFAAVPTDVYLLIGQSNMAGFLGKEG